MRARYWMVAAMLLAAAAGYVLWPSGGAGTPVPAPAAPADAVTGPAPGPLPKPAAQPADAAAQPARTGKPGEPHLVDLARRDALRHELFATDDLLSFVRAHLAEARAGDGEAQFMIGFALSMCQTMEQATMSDGRPARDALGDADATEQQRRIAQNIADRCDAQDQARNEVGTAEDWFRQADRNGVGAAMLMEAGSKTFGSDQARIDKVRQALATADPIVVSMLVGSSDRWNQSRDALETAQPDAGHVLAAEELTECALGYDCSSNGPMYQLWCRHNRCQHADSLQRYYELSMKPREFSAVQDYAATLAANIRSGGDNWPEAQKLEQSVLHPPDPDSP